MKIGQTQSFILKSIWQFKWYLVPLCMISAFWAAGVSIFPYIMKIIVDKLPSLNRGNVVTELASPIGMYITLIFLHVIFFRIYDFIWLIVNPRLKAYIGNHLMSRMMEHSHSFFQNHFAGALGNKVKDVMSSVPDIFKLSIDSFMSHGLAVCVAFIAFSSVSYQFTVALITWASIFCIGSFLFSRHASYLSHLASDVRSAVVGRMVDILGNMMNVRLFSASKFESKLLSHALEDYVKADRRRDIYFLLMYAFQGFSFMIYDTVCIILLIYGFIDGYVSAGDFVLVFTVNGALIESLWTLSEDIGKFAEHYGNIEQGLKISLTKPEIADKSGAVSNPELSSYDITFEKVLFHYKGATPLFQNESITIKAGQKIGLVGYSGSGKTTFVNLILRLYDVTDGRILIGGKDIRDLTQNALREIIGMIPQDPSLFHRTLMENIRYGNEDVSNEAVIEAAKRAHAHEFITNLPEGYDAMVGERGVKLSGGQRQRIAIARAILKNAPILILDEATSQLDSTTERDIQESLLELMQHKTTIVIAHRLSTLLHMDRIIVFDHGKIVEDGTHKTLLDLGGLYNTLWNAQVGGFLPNTTIDS
jgi:ATP-binding cassette subfamily B protein